MHLLRRAFCGGAADFDQLRSSLNAIPGFLLHLSVCSPVFRCTLTVVQQ